MSFADPQTVLATSLVRTGSGLTEGSFSSVDGTKKLEVKHTYGRRTRRMVKLTTNKIVADPLVPTQNVAVSMSTYLVTDTPVNGYSVAEAKVVVDGLVAWLAASTGAAVEDLLSGEQ